jgi:hypothetical protein
VNLFDRIPGDTVVVFDGYLSRWSVFGGDGKFVRSSQLPPDEWKRIGELKGAFSSSTAYSSRVFAPADTVQDFRRYGLALLRVDLDPIASDTVAVLRGQETVFFYLDYPTNWARPSPFAYNAHHAASAAGIVAGESDAFQLSKFGPDGRLLQRTTVNGRQTELGPREVSAAMNADREEYELEYRNADPARRRMLEQAYDRFETSVEHPRHAPAFSRLLMDDEGTVWARSSTPPMSPDLAQNWQVFAPDGRWLGAISTPESLRVHDLRSDRLIGIVRDSLGVETAWVYRIEKQ